MSEVLARMRKAGRGPFSRAADGAGTGRIAGVGAAVTVGRSEGAGAAVEWTSGAVDGALLDLEVAGMRIGLTNGDADAAYVNGRGLRDASARRSLLLLAALLMVGALCGLLPNVAWGASDAAAGLIADASAAESVAGGLEPLRLTVSVAHDECDGAGSAVRVWRVADIGPDGAPVPAAPFDECEAAWDVPTSSSVQLLANALQELVLGEGLEPTDSCVADASGMAVFPADVDVLEEGYYLVVADSHMSGAEEHTALPVLVALPQAATEGSQGRQVSVSAKFSEDGDAPSAWDDGAPEPGEKLPQTGQLWWPVPALLLGGAALMTAGRVLARRRG